jgi:hypothetical protein
MVVLLHLDGRVRDHQLERARKFRGYETAIRAGLVTVAPK